MSGLKRTGPRQARWFNMSVVVRRVRGWSRAHGRFGFRGEASSEEEIIAFPGTEAQKAGEAEDVRPPTRGPGCALAPPEDGLPAHPHPPRQVGVGNAHAFDEFRQEGREGFHRASLVAADATQM